ncbi:MAG: hypothetical protein U0237_00890 [Thermoleophilia bacterium]
MSPFAPDPELVADALLEAHPDAEPFEVEGPVLEDWFRGVGADPEDVALVSAALRAWEARRS